MSLIPCRISATSNPPGVLLGGVYVWQDAGEGSRFGPTRERINPHNSNAVRQFVCNWDERDTLINALGSVSSGLGYQLPAVHPTIPYIYLQDVLAIGTYGPNAMWIDGTGIEAYDYATVTFTYQKLPFSPEALSTGELSVNFSEEVQPLSVTEPIYKFSSGGAQLPAADNPVYRYAVGEFRITRYNLTSLPTALNFSTLGHVNNDTFYGAAPGTMRYLGMSDRKTLGYGFGDMWSVDFGFKWRSIPWNKVFNPSSGQFEVIQLINGGSGSGSGTAGIDGPLLPATAFAPFSALY